MSRRRALPTQQVLVRRRPLETRTAGCMSGRGATLEQETVKYEIVERRNGRRSPNSCSATCWYKSSDRTVYCASRPVAFRFGTYPTGMLATCFWPTMSTTATVSVTGSAMYAVLPSGVSVNQAAPIPFRNVVPVTFRSGSEYV